jgi:hypothetical protein
MTTAAAALGAIAICLIKMAASRSAIASRGSCVRRSDATHTSFRHSGFKHVLCHINFTIHLFLSCKTFREETTWGIKA